MRILPAVLLGSLAVLAFSRPAHAAESYATCSKVIGVLPYAINAPGTYCLKSSLTTASTSAKAITIASDNVTIDCNDFKVSGTGGAASTAIGIYAINRANARIRHCDISGFQYGIYLQTNTNVGGGHVVEDNSLHGNFGTGIRVDGDGSVIRRNAVYQTGGSTPAGVSYGIYSSNNVGISDNTVSGVAAVAGSNASVYGIYTRQNASGTIDSNRVRGLAKDGTGKIYGINNVTSGRLTLRSNDVFGDGSVGSVGLTCTDATGRAKDNIIDGFATGLKLCGDGGQNDVTP